MCSFVKIISVLALSCIAFVAAGVTQSSSTSEKHKRTLVSRECVRCICEARTGCKNGNEVCVTQKDLMYNTSCGLVEMTYAYFIDAGYPTVPGDECSDVETAYANCARNYGCCAKAIENYMQRYKTDCNGDGKIDCEDFAAIHMAGAGACNGTTGQDFAKKVAKCLKTGGGCAEVQDSSQDFHYESTTVKTSKSKQESSYSETTAKSESDSDSDEDSESSSSKTVYKSKKKTDETVIVTEVEVDDSDE